MAADIIIVNPHSRHYDRFVARITINQLPRTLEKSLSPVWLLAGDEPLLIGEAADAIRARARGGIHGPRAANSANSTNKRPF